MCELMQAIDLVQNHNVVQCMRATLCMHRERAFHPWQEACLSVVLSAGGRMKWHGLVHRIGSGQSLHLHMSYCIACFTHPALSGYNHAAQKPHANFTQGADLKAIGFHSRAAHQHCSGAYGQMLCISKELTGLLVAYIANFCVCWHRHVASLQRELASTSLISHFPCHCWARVRPDEGHVLLAALRVKRPK